MMHNEEKMLPYFLRWYGSVAEKIIVYEDSSTDRTLEILRSHPKVEVRAPEKSLLDDGLFAKTLSHAYRDDRSPDFVMAVDADEFVYHESLTNRLVELARAGVEVVHCHGWEMKAHAFPNTPRFITDQIKWGERASWWSSNGVKACVFSPKIDIDFGPGRHSYHAGSARVDHDGLKLLHMRDLGYDFYLWHHQRNAGRLDPQRHDQTWGKHNLAPMSAHQWAQHVARGEWVIA